MKRSTILLISLLVGGPLLTENLKAAEWERNAGISLSSYFSDNICRSGDDPEGRSAARVAPNLGVTGRGARANLSLNASVSYDSLADSNLECTTGQRSSLTNREAVIPSLRYLGDLELIEDWLTLESDAFVGRNPIDPFAPGGIDRFDGRDNVNITYQYGAGATLQRQLFDSGTLTMRYYHNEQLNAVNRLGDSSEDRGEFDLGTERGGNRLSVGIAGRYSEVTFDATDLRPAFDNTLSSAEIRASLRLNSSWQINAMVGEEWNDIFSFRSDIDGFFWDAGLVWTPNTRVEVALGTGERFFSSTPRGSIRYRHRRSEISADYARSLTFPRNLRAFGLYQQDPFEPDFGQLPGDPSTVSGAPTFIGNTPIINEQLNVRYGFNARRTGFSITASDSKQLRLADGGEANFSNLGLTMTRSLSSNLSGNLRLSWNQREGSGVGVGFFGQDSESWRAGVGLNRRLGNDTTINIGYDFTDWDTNADVGSFNTFNTFEENRVTLSLQHQF